jgi:hypothetical protein
MLNENKLVGQTPPYKAVTRYELLIQLSLGGINLNPDFPSKYVKKAKGRCGTFG